MHCFLYKTYTCYELKDPVYVTHIFLSLQCIGNLTNSLVEKEALILWYVGSLNTTMFYVSNSKHGKNNLRRINEANKAVKSSNFTNKSLSTLSTRFLITVEGDDD